MKDIIFKNKFDNSNLTKSDTIAFLGQNTDFSAYVRQYRLAINLIVDNIEQKRIETFDLISLPTLYCIRHLFELISKKYIIFFQRHFQVGPPPINLDAESHKISKLTQYVDEYLKEFEEYLLGKEEKKIIKGFRHASKKLSKHLESVDNESYKLRFHIDTKFQLCFEANYQINCKELLDDFYLYIELNDKVWYLTDLIVEFK